MSEANTIFDNENKLVAKMKFGVAWSSPENKRLGSYDEAFIYDNEGAVLGKISENDVVDVVGDIIGYVEGGELYFSGKKVGSYIGGKSSGLAGIVFIFSQYPKNNS